MTGVSSSQDVRSEVDRVQAMVMADPQVNDLGRAVYSLLADKARKVGLFDVFIGQPSMAAQTGAPRTNVRRSLTRLEKLGYILKHRCGDGIENYKMANVTAMARRRWPRPGSPPDVYRMKQPRRDPTENAFAADPVAEVSDAPIRETVDALAPTSADGVGVHALVERLPDPSRSIEAVALERVREMLGPVH